MGSIKMSHLCRLQLYTAFEERLKVFLLCFSVSLSSFQPCTTSICLDLEGWRISEQADGMENEASCGLRLPSASFGGSRCHSTGLIYTIGPLVKSSGRRRNARSW